MRIKRIEIQGFRGFNELRSIDFHDKLTLIYAPNSYGKTSISEALEWLLYGVTSKVEHADSKEEYKGSYRNAHFPETDNPSVRAYFLEDSGDAVYTAQLTSDGDIIRLVGPEGSQTKVAAWPINKQIQGVPRPFVLQHALKNLLLVKPDERFQGIAQLLGFEALGDMQKSIISLCTAPERKIPSEVTALCNAVTSLQQRLGVRPLLARVQRAFKKKDATPRDIHESIVQESRLRVAKNTPDEALLEALRKIRDDAVGQVFKGKIVLQGYTDEELGLNQEDEHYLAEAVGEEFARRYGLLTTLAVKDSLLKRAQFFELGADLLQECCDVCPYCGQTLGSGVQKHINETHEELRQRTGTSQALERERQAIKAAVTEVGTHIKAYHDRNLSKTTHLLAVEPSLGELEKLLASSHADAFAKVQAAVRDVRNRKENIERSLERVTEALGSLSRSLEAGTIDVELPKAAGVAIVDYVAGAKSLKCIVNDLEPKLTEVDRLLQRQLDAIAGTEDVSLLIELSEARGRIAKKTEVDRILDGLKALRKSADQYVADTILEAISGQLTADVMDWYARIKTTGDPDVHFSGFDLDRTQKGDVKARRVSIKAKSYGRELVSAVSSLSESKLNALGLCVSIATNLKGGSPLGFLIIDDPIQSLDAEHEVQFVQIIRSLVLDRDIQTIVLSHNKKWLDQLREGCQSIDGWFYEVTGYTKAGPHISFIPWQKCQDRLAAVDAILKDPKADSVKLQQAEAEIRIIVAQAAADLYKKSKSVAKNPGTLNAAQVHKMLTECGVDSGLIDRIGQTFCTTDDSHHAPAGYTPNRDRIRQFHSWAHELLRLVSSQ